MCKPLPVCPPLSLSVRLPSSPLLDLPPRLNIVVLSLSHFSPSHPSLCLHCTMGGGGWSFMLCPGLPLRSNSVCVIVCVWVVRLHEGMKEREGASENTITAQVSFHLCRSQLTFFLSLLPVSCCHTHPVLT